jgi:two-component system, NarL family, sensor kinase
MRHLFIILLINLLTGAVASARIPDYYRLFHLIDSNGCVNYEETSAIRNQLRISENSAADHIVRAKLHQNMARYDSALTDARKAFYKKDAKFSFVSNYLLSDNFLYTSEYDSSLFYGMQMLREAENKGYRELEAMSHAHLAKVYYYLTSRANNKETAWFHARKALETDADWPEVQALVYLFFAAMYQAENKFDSVQFYADKASAIWISEQMEYKLIKVYNIMSHHFYLLRQHDKQLFYLEKAKELLSKYRQITLYQLIINNLGDAHNMLGNKDISLQYYKEAITLADSMRNPERQLITRDHLIRFYIKHKNFEKALEYAMQKILIQEQVFSDKLPVEIAKIRGQYELEKKEKEAELLKTKNELLESEKNRQFNFLLSILVGMALILMISTLVFVFNQRRKTAKQRQALLNALIQGETQERSRIAAEIHDSLGQTLTALKMNLNFLEMSGALSKEKIEGILNLSKQAMNESREIAHALHPEALSSKSLSEALEKICLTFPQSENLKIRYHISNLPELDQNTKLHCVRILQELLSNGIKHSGASLIEVDIRAEQQNLTIRYRDNGKGISQELIKNAEGLGLKNIEARAMLLKAALEWDSAKGKGTALTLSIPYSGTKK